VALDMEEVSLSLVLSVTKIWQSCHFFMAVFNRQSNCRL
jgi:hypothetical protein